MKRFPQLALFFLITLLAFTECTKKYEVEDLKSTIDSSKFDSLVITHSAKGWELYSWQVNSSWRYSLMEGTNAQKTLDLIMNNPMSTSGEDSLKFLLSKLPMYEEIIWLGPSWLKNCWLSDTGDIALPPRKIQLEIKEFCDSRNLTITIEE
jgi:hypothetical protein